VILQAASASASARASSTFIGGGGSRPFRRLRRAAASER
jgi:hypothetical protein